MLLRLLLILLAPAVVAAQSAAPDPDLRDRYYDGWLAAVEHLMLDAEYETFLALPEDAHREHFIRRFWEVRADHPAGWRNRALERWRRNVDRVSRQFESFDSDRARAMLLTGRPERVTALRRCTAPLRGLEIWSFSPWQIEAQTDREQTEGFYLLFFVDGDEEGGFFLRHWSREDGFAALMWEEKVEEVEEVKEVEEDPWTKERLLELAAGCSGWDPQAAATTAAAMEAALDEIELFQRLRPRFPDAGWLDDFAIEVAAGAAEPVSGSAEFLFLGSHEGGPASRGPAHRLTLVRGRIELPSARVGRTEGGFLFDRLVLTGDVWAEGRLVDDFRVEHHLSGRAPGGDLALEFYRLLEPGTYTMSLRLEDAEGFGLVRAVQPLEVPLVGLAQPATAPAGERSRRAGPREAGPLSELTQDDVAVATSFPSVELLSLGKDLVVGEVEVRALTTGGGIVRVDFLLDGELAASAAEAPFAAELRLGRIPRRHRLAALARDRDAHVVARDEVVLNGGPHRFALRLVEPVPGAGGRRAQAVVEVPEQETLERVELYFGETLLATLYQPPFLHPLPGRIAGGARFVRAVAYLGNGESVEDLVLLDVPGTVEEIDVRLVELYTSVLDPRGRFVLGLGADAFRVLEDGAPQELVRFETIDRLPIHVALLMDISGSMKPRLEIATESALRFFETVLDPAKDRAALLTFNHVVRLRVPFTHDLERLRYGVTDLAAWQWTRLHDAVIHAGHYFGGLGGKRALVLLSDGVDTKSSFLFKHALEHSLRSGVAVYPIAVDLVDPLTRKQLKQLAAETGGSFYSVDAVEQLDEVYRRLEEELRSQYLLVYHAPDAHRDAFRTVEVRVTDQRQPGERLQMSPPAPQGALRARTIHGYYP